MSFVRTASDILKLELTDEDIRVGISYGIISRAWTYDRMGAQSRGDYGKAIFRIAHGKAVQSALERYLAGQGVTFERDTTDYRTNDYWDVQTSAGNTVDVKDFHVFSDFEVPGRPSLDPGAIASSGNGESWAAFYPMLIPQDQFDRNAKDCYVFAVLLAPSSKRCPRTHEHPRALIALPYSHVTRDNDLYRLVHRAQPASKRVDMGSSFTIEVARQDIRSRHTIDMTIGFGDGSGAAASDRFKLNVGDSYTLSNATSLHYVRWHGDCPRAMGFTGDPLLTVTFKGVDGNAPISWPVVASDFEDVWIYEQQLWFVGWITAEEIDTAKAKRLGIGSGTPGTVAKGSHCYFYPPNSGFQSGTQNDNYYVLPQDLHSMASFVEYVSGK